MLLQLAGINQPLCAVGSKAFEEGKSRNQFSVVFAHDFSGAGTSRIIRTRPCCQSDRFVWSSLSGRASFSLAPTKRSSVQKLPGRPPKQPGLSRVEVFHRSRLFRETRT